MCGVFYFPQHLKSCASGLPGAWAPRRRSGTAARAAADVHSRWAKSRTRQARATLISTSVIIGQLECHAMWAQSSNALPGQGGRSLLLLIRLPVPACTGCQGNRQSAKSLSSVNNKKTTSIFDALYVCVLFSDAVAQSHLKAFCVPNITTGNQSKQ